jgi:hypothetical protein
MIDTSIQRVEINQVIENQLPEFVHLPNILDYQQIQSLIQTQFL